jgi:uncharacterized small protein (DUF1192 family)
LAQLSRIGVARQARGGKLPAYADEERKMFDDDRPKKPKVHEMGMLLDAMSIEELHERIGLLEAEITRLRGAIELKQKSKDAAASAFKF